MDYRLTRKQVEKLNAFYALSGREFVSGVKRIYKGTDNWDQEGSQGNWSDLKILGLIEEDRSGFEALLSKWIRDQEDFDELVYARHRKKDRAGYFHLEGCSDEKDTFGINWRTSLEFYEMKAITASDALNEYLLPDGECFEEFYVLINEQY